jgi:hypothetical protein
MPKVIDSLGQPKVAQADFIPLIPRVRLYASAVQSMPAGTMTTLTFDTEVFDADAMHDVVTNTDRITINTSGVYLVQGRFAIAAGTPSVIDAQILKNGVVDTYDRRFPPQSVANDGVIVSSIIECAKGDYLQLQGMQNAAGALNTVAGITGVKFEAVYLGPGFQAVRAKPVVQYVTPVQFAALSPIDGDEVYFIADATNGVIWHLRYNAGSSSAYKWEFLGGSPLFASAVPGGTGTLWSTGTVVVPATVVIPRAGDYDFEVTATILANNQGGTTEYAQLGLATGGTTLVNAPGGGGSFTSPQSGTFSSLATEGLATGIAASATAGAGLYKNGGAGSWNYVSVQTKVRPRRIS